MVKKRLAEIKKEIEKIRSSVVLIDSRIRSSVKDLNELHNNIINFLQSKKEEWETLSNHTNLNVQLQNEQIMKQLKLDIEQLNEQLVAIEKKFLN